MIDDSPDKSQQKPPRVSTVKRKKLVLEALEKSLGIISTAADAVGVSRRVVQKWLKNDVKFREAAEDTKDLSLDISESALHKLIKKENVAAVIFHLKTVGKKRGYIEKGDVNTNPIINIIIDDTDKSL